MRDGALPWRLGAAGLSAWALLPAREVFLGLPAWCGLVANVGGSAPPAAGAQGLSALRRRSPWRRRDRRLRAALQAQLCKFGVIGDIQYADCPDGTDFSGSQKRYFRNTLRLLHDAVRRWASEDGVDFAVQLGDLIDGRNAGMGEGESVRAAETVLRAFPPDLPRVDLVGNHELYNFPRSELRGRGLRLSGEGLPGVSPGPPDDAVGDPCHFSFLADRDTSRWEVIVLDAYDVSNIGYPRGHPRRRYAEALLATNNPRALQQGVDWFEGVPVEKQRFVPFNGGVGPGQLEWLRGRLRACREAGRRAVVLSHIPILEASTTPMTVLWNAEEVLSALRSEDGRCVVAVLAGHDHESGYAADPQSGIHHLTFLSPLICPPDSGYTGAATVECHEDHLVVDGHGVFCVEGGTRAMGTPHTRIELARVDPRGW